MNIRSAIFRRRKTLKNTKNKIFGFVINYFQIGGVSSNVTTVINFSVGIFSGWSVDQPQKEDWRCRDELHLLGWEQRLQWACQGGKINFYKNMNSFFILPFSQVVEKMFRGTVKKCVTMKYNSKMVKEFLLLFPDSKNGLEAYEAPWCSKSASQCQSSGFISSTSTGKS